MFKGCVIRNTKYQFCRKKYLMATAMEAEEEEEEVDMANSSTSSKEEGRGSRATLRRATVLVSYRAV